MNRRLASAAGLCCALIVSACGATAATNTEETIAPLHGEFVAISGEAVDLEELEGEDVVLWFWAPW